MFTQQWRKHIGYDKIDEAKGITTSSATKDKIIEAAKKVYKDYPEFLRIIESL